MTVMPFRYPASRYETRKLTDLNSEVERERLSRPSLRAFFRLAKSWSLSDEQSRLLLGGMPSSTFYVWKKSAPVIIDVDRLTRLSYLVGIYEALHILYDDDLAKRWISLPNSNQLFAGETPLNYLLRGGLVAMDNVRQLLDARRGLPIQTNPFFQNWPTMTRMSRPSSIWRP